MLIYHVLFGVTWYVCRAFRVARAELFDLVPAVRMCLSRCMAMVGVFVAVVSRGISDIINNDCMDLLGTFIVASKFC